MNTSKSKQAEVGDLLVYRPNFPTKNQNSEFMGVILDKHESDSCFVICWINHDILSFEEQVLITFENLNTNKRLRVQKGAV
jgi:hypothetical protein